MHKASQRNYFVTKDDQNSQDLLSSGGHDLTIDIFLYRKRESSITMASPGVSLASTYLSSAFS